jgi:hypothetical protein
MPVYEKYGRMFLKWTLPYNFEYDLKENIFFPLLELLSVIKTVREKYKSPLIWDDKSIVLGLRI